MSELINTLVDPQFADAFSRYGTEDQHSFCTQFVVWPPSQVRQGRALNSDWPIIIKWCGGNHAYMVNTVVRGRLVAGSGENEHSVSEEFTADPYVRRGEVTGSQAIDQESGGVIPVYFVFHNPITFHDQYEFNPEQDGLRFRFRVVFSHLVPALPVGYPNQQTWWLEWGPTYLHAYGNGRRELVHDSPQFEVFAENDGRQNQRESYLLLLPPRYLPTYLPTYLPA